MKREEELAKAASSASNQSAPPPASSAPSSSTEVTYPTLNANSRVPTEWGFVKASKSSLSSSLASNTLAPVSGAEISLTTAPKRVVLSVASDPLPPFLPPGEEDTKKNTTFPPKVPFASSCCVYRVDLRDNIIPLYVADFQYEPLTLVQHNSSIVSHCFA